MNPKGLKLPNNLRLRFALWSGAMVFLAVVLYGAFVYVTMDVFLHASVRDTLGFAADQVVQGLDIEAGTIRLPETFAEPTPGGERLLVNLVDLQGQPLQQAGSATLLLPPVGPVPDHPVYLNAEPDLSILTVPVRDHGTLVGAVQVAQSTEPLERMLQELLVILAASLPLFVAGSALGGFFLAARLLGPIDRMTQTARRFSTEDLSARIGLPPSDDELGRLAATFDDMLTRIEDSFRRHQQFTADASHELRTPVSVIQAILSVTGRRTRTPEEYQAALADLGTASSRLESLVGDLMVLSRSDRLQPVPDASVDLTDLVEGTAESLRPWMEEKGLELVLNLPSGLSVRGDADALIRVFVNILGNAVRYTSEGTITVTGQETAAETTVEVEDTGVGIGPEDLPKIFDRFFRVEKARTSSGSGLGLSIAQAIVERHHGKIEVRSTLGTGTSFRIVLPRSPR